MATLRGGDKLAGELARLAARLDRAKGATLSVGFFANATYPDGTSVPMVAAIHEYGAPNANIPARPFMRPTVARGEKHWGSDVAKILVATDYDVKTTLGLMGERIKDEIQASIKAVTSPPLAPATIEAKGFDKPLIDTGHMWNSVTYRVK